MTVEIQIGDALTRLQRMPEQSVQCIMTSPPYYGLRDYGVEARRVLRDDGTLWLNIGDSYSAGGNGGHQRSGPQGNGSTLEGERTRKTPSFHGHKDRGIAERLGKDRTPPPGLKPKDLIGIPWMLAFALRADGWYLRQDIIWSKKNPMPESVRDRCTKAHEYLFLLSKSERYYFDAEAIAELAVTQDEYAYAGDEPGLHGGESHAGSGQSTRRFKKGVAGWAADDGDHKPISHAQGDRADSHAMRVKAENNGVGWGYADGSEAKPRTRRGRAKDTDSSARSATSRGPHSLDAFDTRVKAAAARHDDRTVLRGEADVSVSHRMGREPGWREREREREHPETLSNNLRKRDGMGGEEWAGREFPIKRNKRSVWTIATQPFAEAHFATFPAALVEPCVLAGSREGDTVLDPFGGAGTTAMVADRLHRNAILIELNPEYAEMAARRIRAEAPLLARVEVTPA